MDCARFMLPNRPRKRCSKSIQRQSRHRQHNLKRNPLALFSQVSKNSRIKPPFIQKRKKKNYLRKQTSTKLISISTINQVYLVLMPARSSIPKLTNLFTPNQTKFLRMTSITKLIHWRRWQPIVTRNSNHHKGRQSISKYLLLTTPNKLLRRSWQIINLYRIGLSLPHQMLRSMLIQITFTSITNSSKANNFLVNNYLLARNLEARKNQKS